MTCSSNHSIKLYTNDYTALFNNPIYMHLHREIKNAMYKIVLIAAIFDCFQLWQMHFHVWMLRDRLSCRRRREECDKIEVLSLALKFMEERSKLLLVSSTICDKLLPHAIAVINLYYNLYSSTGMYNYAKFEAYLHRNEGLIRNSVLCKS